MRIGATEMKPENERVFRDKLCHASVMIEFVKARYGGSNLAVFMTSFHEVAVN
jgi:hypothetical protein